MHHPPMYRCVFWRLLFVMAGGCAACGSSVDPARAPATEASQAGAPPLVIGRSPSSAPVAAAPDEASRADEGPPVSALAVPARDPRLAKGNARSRTLLLAEVQQLEQLFASVAATAPDRPALARRLADDYAELARVESGAAAGAAHRNALHYYELITTAYPHALLIDEAWYFAALEHEMAGDFTRARRAYFELIKGSPTSKYIPLAYFAFGELFFAEADGDPSKNDLAEQAFKEVLESAPPATNAVYRDALVRLAEVSERKGDAAQAAAMFARLRKEFGAAPAPKPAPPPNRRP